nr:prepilin peptidase [Cohnella kolymensis]
MLANMILLIVLAISVITDLRSRTIYNIVIFPALAAGFVIQAVTNGWAGLGDALLGFTLGLSILIILICWVGWAAGTLSCWHW